MKNTIAFNITSLLYGEALKGPINLVMFVQRFADGQFFKVTTLARIDFQGLPATAAGQEALLIGGRRNRKFELHLVIRSHDGGSDHIAAGYYPDLEPEIYDECRETVMSQLLTKEEILQVFIYVKDNPSVIAPHPYDLRED